MFDLVWSFQGVEGPFVELKDDVQQLVRPASDPQGPSFEDSRLSPCRCLLLTGSSRSTRGCCKS